MFYMAPYCFPRCKHLLLHGPWSASVHFQTLPSYHARGCCMSMLSWPLCLLELLLRPWQQHNFHGADSEPNFNMTDSQVTGTQTNVWNVTQLTHLPPSRSSQSTRDRRIYISVLVVKGHRICVVTLVGGVCARSWGLALSRAMADETTRSLGTEKSRVC